MSYIELFILVALALPDVMDSFIAADKGKDNKTDCINDNENVMKAFRPVGLCFSQVVQDQIGNNTSSEGCHTVEDFNKTFEDFRIRVIESCVSEKDRQQFIIRKKYLYDLMAFSLNNNTFRDFYRNNGTEFLKLIKDDLAKCVTETAGFNLTKSDKLNPRYWLRLNKPIYNHTSCETTKHMKLCTEEKLVKNNSTELNTKYIIGIFDHLLEKCTDATTPSTTEATNKNWAPQLETGPPTIMGAMLMLLLF